MNSRFTKSINRPLSILLVLIMLFSVFPASVFAGDEPENSPVITVQPQSLTVTVGESASFSATVTGDAETLAYQWESSADGTSWNAIDSVTLAVYEIESVTTDMSGRQYRCVVTDKNGSITSDAATLTVNDIPPENPPVITVQPQSLTVTAGESALFSVTATGDAETLAYQWESSADGTNWNAIDSVTLAVYDVESVTTDMNGRQYRCVVTDKNGSITSDAATLAVVTTVVTMQGSEVLTARINGGAAAAGASLQAIVEAAEISPDTVTAMEFTAGVVIADDLAYIKSSLTNLETLAASHTVDINGGVLPAEAFKGHTKLQTVNLPSVASMMDSAFANCSALATVRLTNLRTIGINAFNGCASLDTLVVPNLQEVSDSAFSECSALKIIYMPQAEDMLNGANFANNSALTSAWFPKLGNIGVVAYMGAASFKEMYLEVAPFMVAGYVPGMPIGTFGGVPADRTVYVPAEYVENYEKYADDNSSDKKWYGWTVKSFAESDTLGAFVESLINQLPEDNQLTFGDVPQVEALRTAYNKLTAEQQATVGGAYAKLTEAEAALLGQGNTAAQEIINRIAALPSPVTLEDREEIESIRQAYNNLSEAYQELVTNLATLLAVEEAIAQLEIEAVEELLEQLPGAEELTLLDKPAVQAARNAYDALSPEQQEAVHNDELLLAAEGKIYDLDAQEAARAVDILIEALPSAQEAQIVHKTMALAAKADYNALNELAKTYVTKLQKLTEVLAAISLLEKQVLKGDAVNAKIAALPAVETLTLADKTAVLEARTDYDALTDQEKALVTADNLNKLQAAEVRIAQLESESPASSITVTIEKFTLGQGFIRKPVQVPINPGENGAAVVTRLLGVGNYTNTGSIDSNFYLAGIKDNGPAQANIPAYIIDAITAGEGTVGTRANANFLGQFDYYEMSGWMYTANNISPSYGLSDYIPQDGDVFRLQFTLYGLGGDLGLGGNKLIDAADKDALIEKVASINASEDKLMMFADPVYKGYYDHALLVLQDLQASQAQVDDALANLNTTPNPPAELGTVTVKVQDVVDRKWTTWGGDDETTVEQLTGLGDYQEPFGVLLEDVEVSITPGMTVRQAIAQALMSRGYQVTGTPTYIRGIGPVTSEDYARTVAHLSENDAGSRSKWVMSQNYWCIWDTSQAYPVEDGDVLTLEYSVDGGIDIHCHRGSGTALTVNFTIDGTTYNDVTTSNGYFMVPAGTEEITVSAERRLRYEGRDINRYMVVELQSEGVSVLNKPATFSIADGQVIKAIIDNRYNSPSTANDLVKTYTIEIKRTPAQVDEMIAEIPAPEAIIYADKVQIEKVRRCYDYLTDEEKNAVTELAILETAEAQIAAIYDADRAEANRVIDLIKVLPNVIRDEVVTLEHREAIENARAQYEALTEDQKVLCSSWMGYLERAEAALAELLDTQQAEEGVPKDYSKDFLLSAMAINLTVGEEEEMVIFDTPRAGNDNNAFNRDDLVLELSGQEGVFEIEKRVVNEDGEDLTEYYVKGLSEGIGYFTIKYEGYSGQIPIVPVCVQNSSSQGPALGTDIEDQVSKYDTMYFTEEEGSYPFTFTAESEDGASVSALVYGVTYEPDAGGVFTVPLRDMYNPIIVTATKDGRTTSIAYGIRAKVIAIEITNESRGGDVFYQGDTVSIAATGIMVPVPKVSRIYNPASTRLEFHSDMPRYALVGSNASQYAAGDLTFELTGYGDIALTDGHIHMSWFGSGLYAETPIGGAPPNLNADQIAHNFSRLPDIHLTVIQDPYYAPADVLSTGVVGASTVHAGDEVTISIPGIDTEMLKRNHSTTSGEIVDLLDSYTVFATDIPGLGQVKSVNVKTTDELDNLKTITFTVPENTPPGDYKFKGGYIWVKYGPTWWTRETEYYVTKMEDVDLTVIGEAGQVDKTELNSKIAAVEALAEADYTAASWSALAAALATAQNVAADTGATKGEVDAALAALTQAIEALVLKEDTGKAGIIQNILTAISNGLKGSGADWDVIDMAAYGMGGYMDQETLIANALQVYNGTSVPATEYERVAISLTSMGIDAAAVDDGAGGTANFIEKIANYNPASLGTANAYIYALLAYDAGDYDLPPTANWTREKIVEYLLTAQLDDGGWALSGNDADPDMTGMAISALVGYRDDEDVAAALADAVNCLSAMQTANGGFKSWGTENSNSAAMVIVALSALGIDADTDSRFVKEGQSAIDALLSYKTQDHKFGYTNKTYNAMATEQGFRALVAYTKMLDAGEAYNIYRFTEQNTPGPQPVDKTELNAKIDQASALKEQDYTSATWSALLTALNEAIAIKDSETATQEQVYSALQNLLAALNGLKPADSGGGDIITVTFKLIGDSKHGTADAHEAFQTWISEITLTLPVDSCVYDAFVMALDQYGLAYDETQYNYIGGIKAPASFGGHWLYEFDNGQYSGWMYTVNGYHAGLGLREYQLKNGDDIVWHYTDDYTKEEGSEEWNSDIPITPATPLPGRNSTDDKALAEALQQTGEAKLSLENKEGGKALLSPDILKTVNAVHAIVLEKKGIIVEFPVGSMLTEEFAQLTSAGNSLVELSIKELDAAQKQDILTQAKLGESKGIFDIGGKIMEFTAEVTGVDENGNATREKSSNFKEPIKITMDLSGANITAEEPAELCAVRYAPDAAGNITLVKLGGSYDPLTKQFTFYTDSFSYYGVVKVKDLIQISLVINMPTVKVNGEQEHLDVPASLIDNRTMVPLRFVAETLGAEVDWEGATRTVVITLGEKVLQLTVDQLLTDMDVPVVTKDGRTLVPFRYVAENLGAHVTWHSSEQRVDIVK